MTSTPEPDAPSSSSAGSGRVTCGITVSVDGFADAAGLVDDLWLHIAPVTLGAGERLFEGADLALQPVAARHTDLVMHMRYRVRYR
jgi:riboflavin biosynthesis pyrimidine reductase